MQQNLRLNYIYFFPPTTERLTKMQISSSIVEISRLMNTYTPMCQINESTRLPFLDFPPPCIWTCHILFLTLLVYLALLILLFHPTPLFGPISYEIYIEYQPYSFIWPYLFNWHLWVATFVGRILQNQTTTVCFFDEIPRK
jgi:hypothetical protein